MHTWGGVAVHASLPFNERSPIHTRRTTLELTYTAPPSCCCCCSLLLFVCFYPIIITYSSRVCSPNDAALTLKLAGPGTIREASDYKFSFAPGSADLTHESYNGLQVRVRYLVRVNISRNYNMGITNDLPIWVMNVSPAPEINNSIKMEVGIEDCLHIEFEYSKGKYHLDDVVVGKIYFLLVRIRIKHMELEIRRRESTGTGANTYNETETIAKYEVMDGAPVRGECTPIRLFLAPYDLTPTYKNVDNKFSVKYFFNLVLVDEEDRRYFKQQEILLYRDRL